jgi:hypothetical protein
MPEKIKAFVSCAQEDRELQKRFVRSLIPLMRKKNIELYDGIVSAGTEWQPVINTYLNSCQLILLLISPDFLASDYCCSQEMQRAVDRHDSGEVLVIPIILRPTDWHDAPFSKLQVLPTDGKPVTTWHNRDKAFYEITKGIRQAIEKLSLEVNNVSLLSDPRTGSSQVKKND